MISHARIAGHAGMLLEALAARAQCSAQIGDGESQRI
jgi:hypothetical protein